MARPYTLLRAANSAAPPNADAAEPPAPSTLTAENCEAPVNTSSDITHAWATDAPAETAVTPNDTANTPTAMPNVTHAAKTARRRSSRHDPASLPAFMPG